MLGHVSPHQHNLVHSAFPPARQDAGAITAAVIANRLLIKAFCQRPNPTSDIYIYIYIYASQCETPSASVFRLVGGKPTLPCSLSAIVADPYLSCPGLSRVRSCMYMVDLIMITAPHDQTPSIPPTPPTLPTLLRQLEAAARVPS